jgi:hypothetical protein
VIVQRATSWPEADRLFRSDPRWLGGDDAYSVELAPGRVLWVFGDSFIGGPTRRDATFVHSTVAVQTGSDPSTAALRFVWREGPRSFLPEDGDVWRWPGSPVVVDGTLLLFTMRVRARDVPGLAVTDAASAWHHHGSLGFFEVTGWDCWTVADHAGDPAQWELTPALLPDAVPRLCVGPGAIVLDGHLHVYASRFADDGAVLGTQLWRWSVSDAAAGDLRRPEVWTDDGWSAEGMPVDVLPGAGTEFTVHRLPGGGVMQVQSAGAFHESFGARTAPRPEGPWGEIVAFHSPPSRSDAFTYAVKAHPHLAGADLVVTCASIALTANGTLDDEELYVPRFVRATIG